MFLHCKSSELFSEILMRRLPGYAIYDMFYRRDKKRIIQLLRFIVKIKKRPNNVLVRRNNLHLTSLKSLEMARRRTVSRPIILLLGTWSPGLPNPDIAPL